MCRGGVPTRSKLGVFPEMSDSISRETVEEVLDQLYEESEELAEEAHALDTPPTDLNQIKNYQEAEKMGKADALVSAAQYIESQLLDGGDA